MMCKFFNIVLDKAGYVDNDEMQEGLRRTLISEGAEPIDAREADVVASGTKEKIMEVLIVQCLEARPGVKELFKAKHGMNEIVYEGLPTLI